jgi:hypothetical protein
MRKSFILAVLLSAFSLSSFSLDLSIGAEDMYVTQGADGGYHLFVKKKKDIGSILITESTADPAKQADSFAYRNKAYHPVNGDERRMLNGEFIPQERGLFSLMTRPRSRTKKSGRPSISTYPTSSPTATRGAGRGRYRCSTEPTST